MSVALISGIVVPHWKLTLIAASIVPRATCGKFSAAFASCSEPKSWTSTWPFVRCLTSAAKALEQLRHVVRRRHLMRDAHHHGLLRAAVMGSDRHGRENGEAMAGERKRHGDLLAMDG